MKKNLLISTGGSGGHVIPALILYEHLSNETNVIFSIDKRGLEYIDKDLHSIEIIGDELRQHMTSMKKAL